MNQAAVIESGRAEFALNAVKSVKKVNEKTQKEYKSYTRKFPTLVLTNGLAAAIAFVAEKKSNKKNEPRNGYNYLYEQLSDWLVKNGFFDNSKELMEYICTLKSDEYRVVSNEVLALFVWLSRLASGMIEGEADE